MKKMIFVVVVFLSVFSNLQGMLGVKRFHYGNEKLRFEKLTKNQRATLMLVILDDPKDAIEKLRDIEKNNFLHLILSSYNQLTLSFVNNVFKICLPHLKDPMLREKNDLHQTPLGLIDTFEAACKQFYIDQLRTKGFIVEEKPKKEYKKQFPLGWQSK